MRAALALSLCLVPALAVADGSLRPLAVGKTAPAFGLDALNPTALPADRAGAPVVLDSYCGIRDKGVKAVLVTFVGDAEKDDLNTANGWQRTFGEKGFQALAIATAPDPTALAAAAAKSSVPLLDDRVGVVATRYGQVGAPYSLVLDGECRVVGRFNVALSASGTEVSELIEALVEERIPSRRRLR